MAFGLFLNWLYMGFCVQMEGILVISPLKIHNLVRFITANHILVGILW